MRFERLNENNNNKEHLMPIIELKVNKNHLQIIAVTSCKVHIFDILTGSKMAEFDANIMENKTTSNSNSNSNENKYDLNDLNANQSEVNITSCCFEPYKLDIDSYKEHQASFIAVSGVQYSWFALLNTLNISSDDHEKHSV